MAKIKGIGGVGIEELVMIQTITFAVTPLALL